MQVGQGTPALAPADPTGTGAWLAALFDAAMERMGPFEPAPRLAAAVSGGADSMALAVLARDWVRARHGSLLALVVDHGLRPESAAEAELTCARLDDLGIGRRLLRLTGLARGSAMAERARAARYGALRQACAADRRVHLLLGHHAADQAETVLIRQAGGSGPDGLAAMPALLELHALRLLRPLLAAPPGALRAMLRAQGIRWVEDPSNTDQAALRPRLRRMLSDPEGAGPRIAVLCAEARQAGDRRAASELQRAAELGACVSFHPEGFARIGADRLSGGALAAVIQAVTGAPYPPPSGPCSALAASLRPATLAGARIMTAGRIGQGWLVVREAAAAAPPVPAEPGAVWDGRFQLAADAAPPEGSTLGALGADASRLRRRSWLPAAVLRTIPALRVGNSLAAVPHLLYPSPEGCARLTTRFIPRRPAASAPFLPA